MYLGIYVVNGQRSYEPFIIIIVVIVPLFLLGQAHKDRKCTYGINARVCLVVSPKKKNDYPRSSGLAVLTWSV